MPIPTPEQWHSVHLKCDACDVMWRGLRNSRCWICDGPGEYGLPDLKSPMNWYVAKDVLPRV